MITGKDKERVQMLEIENKSAKELITKLKDYMEESRNYLIKTYGVDILIKGPLVNLTFGIGRCEGFLESFK